MGSFREGVRGYLNESRSPQAPALLKELLDRGLEPGAAQNVVAQFLRTGETKIPSMQTRYLEPDLSSSDVFERSTREPVNLGPKREQLFSFDTGTGTYIKGPGETGRVKPVVNKFNSAIGGGYDITIDSTTGEELRREANNDKQGRNRYIYIRPQKPSGSGGANAVTPSQRWALKTLDNAQKMRAKGELTAEMNDEVGVAAQILGMDTEEALSDPTLGDRIQNLGSTVTKGKLPAAQPRPGARKVIPQGGRAPSAKMPDEYQKDLEQARRAVAAKAVPSAEAAARMRKKWGARFKGL